MADRCMGRGQPGDSGTRCYDSAIISNYRWELDGILGWEFTGGVMVDRFCYTNFIKSNGNLENENPLDIAVQLKL